MNSNQNNLSKNNLNQVPTGLTRAGIITSMIGSIIQIIVGVILSVVYLVLFILEITNVFSATANLNNDKLALEITFIMLAVLFFIVLVYSIIVLVFNAKALHNIRYTNVAGILSVICFLFGVICLVGGILTLVGKYDQKNRNVPYGQYLSDSHQQFYQQPSSVQPDSFGNQSNNGQNNL